MSSRARLYRRRAIRRFMLLIVIAVVIFVSGLAIGGLRVHAQSAQSMSDSVVTEQTCYTSIEVKDGDTLWSIAEQYVGGSNAEKQAYVDEVIKLNHIKGGKIQTGSYIMIPYSADTYSASL